MLKLSDIPLAFCAGPETLRRDEPKRLTRWRLSGMTRKLAAILAADVIGYSRLNGRGRGRHRELGARAARGGDADRGRGRIVKTTGDGVMLDFPPLSPLIVRSRSKADD
jgi:class 3 adenylate cyclase